jgi:hypothetical protein
MLLRTEKMSAISSARAGGVLPAVENDLTSATGKEGSVGLGGLDVVTARGGQTWANETNASQALTLRRAVGHQATQENGARPLIST